MAKEEFKQSTGSLSVNVLLWVNDQKRDLREKWDDIHLHFSFFSHQFTSQVSSLIRSMFILVIQNGAGQLGSY